eukprot:gene19419-26076_t
MGEEPVSLAAQEHARLHIDYNSQIPRASVDLVSARYKSPTSRHLTFTQWLCVEIQNLPAAELEKPHTQVSLGPDSANTVPEAQPWHPAVPSNAPSQAEPWHYMSQRIQQLEEHVGLSPPSQWPSTTSGGGQDPLLPSLTDEQLDKLADLVQVRVVKVAMDVAQAAAVQALHNQRARASKGGSGDDGGRTGGSGGAADNLESRLPGIIAKELGGWKGGTGGAVDTLESRLPGIIAMELEGWTGGSGGAELGGVEEKVNESSATLDLMQHQLAVLEVAEESHASAFKVSEQTRQHAELSSSQTEQMTGQSKALSFVTDQLASISSSMEGQFSLLHQQMAKLAKEIQDLEGPALSGPPESNEDPPAESSQANEAWGSTGGGGDVQALTTTDGRDDGGPSAPESQAAGGDAPPPKPAVSGSISDRLAVMESSLAAMAGMVGVRAEEKSAAVYEIRKEASKTIKALTILRKESEYRPVLARRGNIVGNGSGDTTVMLLVSGKDSGKGSVLVNIGGKGSGTDVGIRGKVVGKAVMSLVSWSRSQPTALAPTHLSTTLNNLVLREQKVQLVQVERRWLAPAGGVANDLSGHQNVADQVRLQGEALAGLSSKTESQSESLTFVTDQVTAISASLKGQLQMLNAELHKAKSTANDALAEALATKSLINTKAGAKETEKEKEGPARVWSAAVSELQARVEEVEKGLGAVKAGVREVGSDASESLELFQRETSTRLSKADSKLVAIDAALTALQQRNSALSSALSVESSGIKALREGGLTDRLEALEGKVWEALGAMQLASDAKGDAAGALAMDAKGDAAGRVQEALGAMQLASDAKGDAAGAVP